MSDISPVPDPSDPSTLISLIASVVATGAAVLSWVAAHSAVRKAAAFNADQARWEAGRSFIIDLRHDLRWFVNGLDGYHLTLKNAVEEQLASPGNPGTPRDFRNAFAEHHEPSLRRIGEKVDSLWIHFRTEQVKRMATPWHVVVEHSPPRAIGTLPKDFYRHHLTEMQSAIEAVMKEERMHGDVPSAR